MTEDPKRVNNFLKEIGLNKEYHEINNKKDIDPFVKKMSV